jgi:hypothetical protein
MLIILGKAFLVLIGLGALLALLAWLVEWGFAAAGDASAIGGKPSWWAGPVYLAVLAAAIVALVKG